MSQAELLSTILLRFDETVRRSALRDGCVRLRTAGGRQQLVLTPAQAAILTDYFAQPATGPAVLARLLNDHACPPLSEYYELVLQAHVAGVLVAGEEVPPPSLAGRWPLRLPLRAAGLVGVAGTLAGAVGLAVAPWNAPPVGWAGLAGGWLIAVALLSAGEALAACALAGGGCEVRAAHFHWKTLLPHFHIDDDEAAMGGGACEQAVAALRVAPSVLGAAVLAWKWPDGLAPVLAGLLYLLAPTRGSAARQWLGARFGAPRFSVGLGFLFAPRRWDVWAQWSARWAGFDFKYGLLWLGWVGGWSIFCVVAFWRCFPGRMAMLAGWSAAAGRPGTLLRGGVELLAAAGLIAAAVLATAGFRHWRFKRTQVRPLRGGDAGGAGALTGDIPTALRQIALFQTLAEDDLNALAETMQLMTMEKGAEVFGEDDPGDAFYVVLEGGLEILKRRPPPSRRLATIGWLGPGDCFGEIALLTGASRTATIRAARPGRLLRLGKEDFERLVLGRVGAARVRELLQYAAFLGRLVFLAGWPFDDLVRYAQRCGNMQFDAGVKVLKKGEPNIWFFLIYDGAFEARDGERVLRRMAPGDYFGEISLLAGEQATADVVAIEESRCLTLSRADFLSFFARDFRIGLRMEALASQRLGARLLASR